MKKIILLFLLTAVWLHAREITEINEYKVDLYYANGIMMQDDKGKAEMVWKARADDLLSSSFPRCTWECICKP